MFCHVFSSIERIPTVPESSSSVLFSAIRVITVNPGTMSQQPHKDEGWLRMSECDGARQKTDLLSGIRVIIYLLFYSFIFAVCHDVFCAICRDLDLVQKMK